jgi:THO complex subunit 1
METLELLLEAQTVQNTERLFAYLETRMDRLTEGMMPGKGKALVILRTLNDLLRRLSKSTHTVFCGRILLFLASIFPLGERSGVNLRGEFNKENITYFEPEEPRPEEVTKADDDTDMEDEKDESIPTKGKNGKTPADKPKIQVVEPEDGEEVESMDLDASVKAAAGSDGVQVSPTHQVDKKRASNEPEFYTLFWSLQRYFSNPQSLFTSAIPSNLPPILLTFASSFPSVPTLAKDGSVSGKSTAAATPNLTLLREGVQKMLFVFGEASKKEKALQGASKEKEGSGRGSRERKTSEAEVKKMFFYPKFLTSKALIDLEVWLYSRDRRYTFSTFIDAFCRLPMQSSANRSWYNVSSYFNTSTPSPKQPK